MTVESFDEQKILSLEDLIENLHRNIERDIDTTFSEIIRRSEVKKEYYAVVLELEKPTTRQVLSALRESGGSQRFTDIKRFVDCSPSTLANALRELVERGLVRWERGLYQAASPTLFAQKKLEQKEKTKNSSINRSKPV